MTDARTTILCPKCRQLIARDEARCPHCGLRRPASGLQRLLQAGGGAASASSWMRAILFTNIGMFLISLLISPKGIRLSANPLYFLSPDNGSLFLLGASGAIPFYRYHRWWTLVAANYLHGGMLHIFFNMAAFWQLAPLILREFGPWRMFAIYTISGIVGFWVSCLAGVPLTIGASAAVCGLIGAAIYFGRARGGAYGRAVFRQLGGWAIGILLFGLLIPGINNWGHVAGFAAGVLLGYFLGYTERRAQTSLHKAMGISCALLTVLVLGVDIVFALMYRMAG